MTVTIFRSRLRADGQDDYETMAARMDELAASMPGYIAHKGFTADDGERVTLVEFESEEALRAWRLHPEHREAQRRGRERYYSMFKLQTCEVIREINFARDAN